MQCCCTQCKLSPLPLSFACCVVAVSCVFGITLAQNQNSGSTILMGPKLRVGSV